jgi:predicted nucleic acid-binding protein
VRQPWAIIDTSAYIDHWRHGLRDDAMARVTQGFVVRLSAVVLSELRRGARDRASGRVVEGLRTRSPEVWEPNAQDWWEAGRLIRLIGDAEHFDRTKRRDFQNDALIALTARRHGAVVVTSNAKEFQLLGRALRVRILAVAPNADDSSGAVDGLEGDGSTLASRRRDSEVGGHVARRGRVRRARGPRERH